MEDRWYISALTKFPVVGWVKLASLGITDPGLVSWGKMMHHALRFTYLEAWRWWLLPPGLALSVTVTAVSFIGYALEKAINPRLRKGAGHAGH